MIDIKPSAEQRAAVLKRLADELNVPVETFLNGPDNSEIDDLATLVRLWLEIENPQGRRRVLSVARQEVDRATYRKSA